MAKINYNNLKEKECIYCKMIYQPTGPAHLFCSECKKHLKSLETQVSNHEINFKKNGGRYIWRGKGGSQGTGEANSNYKNGIGIFSTILSPAVKTRRYCERCNKDLKNASPKEWCAHHRDHDRFNNTIDNIELLCKRCHQLEHDCIKQLDIINNQKSATTISKESTPKQVEAVSDCDHDYIRIERVGGPMICMICHQEL